MKPTKLSDSDKREIIRLYRQSEENTITLAKRYGVSSSTVRRLLQSAFSELEYESLVHQKQKRLPDRTIIDAQETEVTEVTVDSSSSSESSESPVSANVPQSMVNRRPKIRQPALSTSEAVALVGGRKNLESDLDVAGESSEAIASSGGSDYVAVTAELKAILPEEGVLGGEDFSDFDEDEDDSDLDDLDGENLGDEDSLFEGSLLGVRSSGDAIRQRVQTVIEVLPLSEAYIPRVCYVVVDRAAELITRPLKAFGELGQIPPAEIREKTLPVFDNHRVAGRFATRHQRVFKIPDGKMLQKTAPYLQAKGITRLLIDGQVYSL